MLREIQAHRRDLELALTAKNIDYEGLRAALVPSQTRREIALIFDSHAVGQTWYGLEIFKEYMPLFDRQSSNSILMGDYGTSQNRDESRLRQIFCDTVMLARDLSYRHSTQFFIVYINNLSEEMFVRFATALHGSPSYVGYADMSNGSFFKYILSTMLANVFIKHGLLIIQGHEDDRSNDENVNLAGLPFEQYGYACRSVVSYLHGMFLSYKIERPIFNERDIDTEFSLNAVCTLPLPLDGFSIEVDEAKTAYIRIHNASSIARAGLEQVSSDEIKALVASKIKASYIYRLEYLSKYDVIKFNLIIEVPDKDGGRPVRFLAALEYRPKDQVLRLITLY